MSKKAKTAPIPDYTALAEQNTTSQRSSQYNPWGSQQWFEDPNSASGWSQATSLNPMDQQNLDSYRGLQGQMMGQAGQSIGSYYGNKSSTPYTGGNASAGMAGNQSYKNLPSLADPNFAAVQEVQDAMMSRMQPDMERARQQQEAQLVAQGVGGNTGGEAWDRSQMMIGRNENDQRQQALLGAMGAYNDIFNRSLANRSQVAGEQANMAGINAGIDTSNAGNRTQTSIANMGDRTSNQQFNSSQDFKDMMAMLAGVQSPQMPNFGATGGTDYLAAGNQQYNALQNQYNSQNQSKSGMWGTIGGLAGSMFGPIGSAAGSAIGKSIFG